jgi:excisionase family DNA binding protein
MGAGKNGGVLDAVNHRLDNNGLPPQDPMSNDRLYLTIAEAAQLLGVSPSTLRNWEQMGLIKPVRSQGRYRMFSMEVLERAKQIIHLRHGRRLNLAGLLQLREILPKPAPRTVRKSGLHLSEQLARLRRERQLTLAQVSEAAGLSVSFLSALERGQANASVATLQKMAHLYGVNVRSFFGDSSAEQRLVRPRDRRVLEPQPGVRMEHIACGDTVMDPSIFRIAPGAASGGSYHHEGEEFIYMLRGTLEVWLDELERYTLEARDCLYFKSTQSHRWQNLGDKEAVLLWVNTPPTF